MMTSGIDLSKQEEFIDNIYSNIQKDIQSKNNLTSEVEKLNNLQSFIQTLIDKDLKKFKMEYDIGCSVYYEAEIISNNKIIMNIGSDVFIEVEFKQALILIEKKLNLLNKKVQLLDEQIIKNKAYYKHTLTIMNRLKSEIY